MPEHTLPDALHPQQEDAADELQLRGGLKGRFFADFCLLQSTVDALQNYLVHAATPDVQDGLPVSEHQPTGRRRPPARSCRHGTPACVRCSLS